MPHRLETVRSALFQKILAVRISIAIANVWLYVLLHVIGEALTVYFDSQSSSLLWIRSTFSDRGYLRYFLLSHQIREGLEGSYGLSE